MDLAASSLVASCFLSLTFSLSFVFVFVWPAWVEKKMRQRRYDTDCIVFGGILSWCSSGEGVEGRGLAASLLSMTVVGKGEKRGCGRLLLRETDIG